MSVRSGQSIVVEFTTASFSTGAATNADSLPTATLVLNGVDNAAVVTVTNVDTGRYKAAVTLPTLAIGDVVELSVAATVSTVAGKAIIWRDTKDILLDASGDVTFNNTSIATVTTVTNQLTAAQIATGVWQDATAGDFTTAGSIGKSLFTSGNAPGAASGLALVGSNVGTASSVTGNVGGSVVGDIQGKVLGGGASTISGVGVNANVTQSAGTTIHNSDGTLASATASTVTFPTTDAAGNAIPDDARYQYTVIQIVAGTGLGQIVLLTTKNGVRTFNILSGTAPVLLDATSQYNVLGSWRSELELWSGTAPNALISGRVDANAQASASALSFNLTGNITGNLSGSVGSVTGAVGSVTGNVGGSVATIAAGGISNTSFTADTGKVTVRSGTAQAGTSTSITLDAGASATTNYYINDVVYLTGGTGAGQARFCTAYNGTTKVATVQSAWATTPDATTTFAILPFDSIPGATAPTAAQVATAVWTDLLAGSDFSTASSIGNLLKTDVDATISSRQASGNVTVGAYAAGQDPATLVLDATASSHNTAGSIGADINLVGTNLDAKVSTRSAPATAQTIDQTTALPGTPTAGTIGEALKFADTRLDAAVSTRSAPATAQTVDFTTSLPVSPTAGTVGEALKKADTNLDTTIGSRAAPGAQMDLVNAPNATAVTAIQSGLSKPGTAQTIDLTTAVPTTGNVAHSIADALNAARAQGFGKWTIVGTTFTLYASDGTTVVKTFTLDSSTAPTSRS